MWFAKLKAGALQVTLSVVIVIALLLMSFVLLVHLHHTFNTKTDKLITSIKQSDYGIAYGLNNPITTKDTIVVKSSNELAKDIKLHKSYWGIFEKLSSTTSTTTHSFTKICLAGASQPKERLALYLQDNNKPLVIAGSSKIEGLAYLPKRGIKSGTINGHSYHGNELVYGLQNTASALPKLEKNLLYQIKSLVATVKNIPEKQILDIEPLKTHKNSFHNETQLIYATHTLHLNAINLTGNIIVYSETKLVVEPTTSLKDVILIAPEIIIKANTTGSFQAFASKTLSVEHNVTLTYPSALVLLEKQDRTDLLNSSENPTKLSIKGRSQISGAIVYIGMPKQRNVKPQVSIESSAIIKGEVYSNQNTDLKGAVLGTVFTSNFVAEVSGSAYQNHLYNGNISSSALHEEYVGILFNDSKKGIVKWLY